MKLFFKSINVFVSILLIAAAIVVAMLAFPIFGNQALIVRSGSMEPSIGVGAIIVVRPASELKVGNIIAFRSEKNSNTVITHRIASIEKDARGVYYKTKGDANKNIDGWQVGPENILGRNFAVIPEFGKVLTFARSKYGFPTLIIIPAILVILLELVNIIREFNKRSKRRALQISHLDKEVVIDSNTISSHSHNLNGAKVLIPILLFVLVGTTSTFAFFSDTEVSSGNFFTAASSFGTPTPTPTPSVTVTPTPSLITPTPTTTPTPTPQENCGSNNTVTVTGGGTGSVTTGGITSSCTNIVEQANITSVDTNINTTSNSGGNTSSNNSSSTNTTTTNSQTTTTSTITSGSNASN